MQFLAVDFALRHVFLKWGEFMANYKLTQFRMGQIANDAGMAAANVTCCATTVGSA